MAHETLKTLITQNIKTNGQNAITAQILQDVLIAMVDEYPDISGYATQSWVQQQEYITASALSGYATQSWVASQLAGYATTSQLAGYLPLTGGTLTGTLTVNSNIVGYNIQSDGVITAGGNVTATGFIKRDGQANQFLKADGSVDSNSYALASSLSNYLPLSGGTLTGNLDLGGNTLEMAIGDYSSSLNGSSLTFSHTEGQASIRLSTVDKFLSLTGAKILLNGVDSSTYITESALTGYATQSWVASQLAGYATTSQLAGYLPLTGGTLTGTLTVNSNIVGYNIQSDGVITAGGNVTATGFIKRDGQANQFLKADGSVDSNSYALASSLSNYLPLSGGTLTGNLDLGGNTLEMAIGDYSSSLNGSSLTFSHTEGQASIRLSTTDKFLSLTGAKILLNGVDSSTYVTASALSGYATQSWVNTQLADYLPLTGGTMAGEIDMNGQAIVLRGDAYIYAYKTPNFDYINMRFNGANQYTFDNNIVAAAFKKSGGTSDQLLCADGSVKTLSELKAALNAV